MATRVRGGLRGFVGGWAGDAHAFEAGAEGVGVEAEEGGGAVGAFDDPIRLLEDGEDVGAFEGVEGGWRGGGERRGPPLRCAALQPAVNGWALGLDGGVAWGSDARGTRPAHTVFSSFRGPNVAPL